jgi:phosphoglycolate phosphatase-like HAD superfamily hydrolase
MIKAVISDSDGTLVNTIYLIRHGQYEAAVEYLTGHGVPRKDIPDFEVYETYINKSVGGPTRETFEKTIRLLFSENHEHHLNKIDFDELNTMLEPIQDHIAPLYVHPFHGLTELFTWLGKNKMSFGIFTSGNPRMIIRNFGVSLPVLGFSDIFKSDEIPINERLEAFISRAQAVYGISELKIITCDDVSKPKPNPEGILRLQEQLGVPSDEIVVLGDHAVDMEAAKAAGLHPIGISHGFGTPAELKEAGAIMVVDDLASLPTIIEAHNSGKHLLFS